MVTIQLYKYADKNNVVNKSLGTATSASGLLHDVFNIINPILTIRTTAAPFDFNYCYIPDFGRYYFIDSISIIDNQRAQISLKIDVLNTYKTAILTATATATNRENSTPYISTRENVHDVRPQFAKIPFSVENPFVENGDIILTTIKGNV